jgi:hypothetical protein
MKRSLPFLVVGASVVAAICEVAFASPIPLGGTTATTTTDTTTTAATITVTTTTETTTTTTTTAPVAEPLITIERVYFHSVWSGSQLRGAFIVAGTASRRLTLAVTLHGNGRTLHWHPVVGPAKFRAKLGIPSNLLPARYPVSFVVPSAPRFAIKPRLAVLYPPPEGVVSRVFTSAAPVSVPRTKFPHGTSIIYAQFFFAQAALPKPGHRMTTQWFDGPAGDANARTPPKAKIRAPAVVAFIGTLGGQPLQSGAYTCVLRAGGVFVRSVTAYVK